MSIFKVELQPGEYFVGNASHRITTLLGSCVSITIWHARARIGAMSHFLLPTRGESRGADPASGRYGDEAMCLMLDELRSHGIAPEQCEAKIFGGGDMFPNLANSLELNIGKRNGVAAKAIVENHGLRVISSCLFGNGYRRIIFDVSTGHVWSRQTPVTQQLHQHEAKAWQASRY